VECAARDLHDNSSGGAATFPYEGIGIVSAQSPLPRCRSQLRQGFVQIEDTVGMEPLFDVAHQAHGNRIDFLVDKRPLRNPNAMLARECAPELDYQGEQGIQATVGSGFFSGLSRSTSRLTWVLPLPA
jgi:hypothetical protein